MKRVLNKKDVVWRTRRYLDYIGEVFEFESKAYRLINRDKEDYVKKLFSDSIIKDMMEKRWFVRTWISDDISFEGEEDRMILEHEYIEHVSYCHEWTYHMFLDARSMLAKMNIYLLKKGYELRDPTLSNVCFIGCRPIYLDLGSIMPAADVGLNGWNVFCQYWVNPDRLVLEKRISMELFRKFLFTDVGLTRSDLMGLLRTVKTGWLNRLREAVEYRLYDNKQESGHKSVRAAVGFLHGLPAYSEGGIRQKKMKKYARFAAAARVKEAEKGYWSDYHDSYTKDGKVVADERFSYYMDLIGQLQAKGTLHDVFEIAGNSGVMSQLLLENRLIDYAVVSDYDAGGLEHGYARCKDNKVISRKIMFSVINIMDMDEKAHMLRKDRYRSDLVMALAVTHHLILTQKIKLSVIVDILESYTNRYVIVEFMPLGLWAGDDEACPPVPDWYTLDWFLEGVKEKFHIIKVENISKNRIGVLGEKQDKRWVK